MCTKSCRMTTKMVVIFKQRHRHHIITFTVVILTFVFEKKYFFIILQYNHDLFFFEILRRNPLSKCWPKMIPLRTSCRRITSHLSNLTYLFSLLLWQLEIRKYFSDTMSAGESSVPKSGGKSPS